ncbi:hypothetical protein BMF89_07745 [Arthrobacter sp. SRS-W-1-2016]|nr:hypothetical protein BMF89_07745 [Arthrobacter sp. SRS-W-1-2016]
MTANAMIEFRGTSNVEMPAVWREAKGLACFGAMAFQLGGIEGIEYALLSPCDKSGFVPMCRGNCCVPAVPYQV